MYQAEITPCTVLTLQVLRGRNITKGSWRDLFDTPDPYIKIYIKEPPGAHRQTRCINNNENPEWNQKFRYLLPNDLKGITAEFTLMDSNAVFDDENMGSVKFDLGSIGPGETVTKTFEFNKTSQVDIEFSTEIRRDTDLKLSASLCDKEEIFRKARKQKIFKSMSELLQKNGKKERPRTADEVPIIGVLGSGGGFRAMVGYAGVMKALHDTGILDCSMYVNGLSGSTWYLATLYANEAFPKAGVQEINNYIRSRIERNPFWSFLKNFYSFRKAVISKRYAGQPVSFTDIFGMFIGKTLLGKKNLISAKMSKFDEKIKDGNAPMPILTAVHVRSNETAKTFHDWVEIGPYEIGMAKYGSFMDTDQFGTKFFRGVMSKYYDESPLHYIMGICGSAYSILLKTFLKSLSKGNPLRFITKPIWQIPDEPSDLDVQLMKRMKKNLEKRSGNLCCGMECTINHAGEVGLASDDDEDKDNDDDTDEETPPAPQMMKEAAVDDLVLGDGGDTTDEDEEQEQLDGKEEESQNMDGLSGWLLEKAFGMDNLRTRGQRTAKVFNYMREIDLKYAGTTSRESEVVADDKFSKINEPLEVDLKKVYLADAGIAFNSPYPPMLRAERGVDIILSFDFSARKEDDMDPFEQLYMAEEWAKMSGLPFPKISRDTYKKEGLKECYVFRDEENEKAPIVMHFVLCNINFRKYSAPGVPRAAGDDQGNFDIFSTENSAAGENPYSTFNFQYKQEEFDKLSQLTEFNTLLHLDTIIEQIVNRMSRH
ncbi:unnamed protein product [Clavelina lepadiformis]|uniref:Phospholipase A2 n=1 Tax=Clavelina lepadiformis TaxID=159417 RepID=A0ABP0F117_CLALP